MTINNNKLTFPYQIDDCLLSSFGTATVSAGSYSRYLKHETLRSPSAQNWVENVSRIAEQHNTSCVIEAFSSGLVQEAESNPADCVIPESIQLEASVSGEVDDEGKILIAFTPKGTSAEGQELELSVDGLDTHRCIL